MLDHLRKAFAFQQDGGVGHGLCHRDDIPVGDVGLIDDIIQLGFARQIMDAADELEEDAALDIDLEV